MVWPIKCRARSVAAGLPLLLLALLLIACSGTSGQSTGTSNSTGTGNSSSSGNSGNNNSTTNPVQNVLTPTATYAASTLSKTYTGSDFTIKYPANWKTTTSNNEVVFTDPTGDYTLTVGSTANPQGATTSAQLIDGGVSGAKTNLKDTQTVDVPQTTTLDNQTWDQRSLTGTGTLNGKSSDIKAVVLATNYPEKTSKTRGYVIVYVATKDQFDQAESTYFKPMLQSFKFAS